MLGRLIVNAVALLVTAHFINGIELKGVMAALIAALVLGVVNAVIRPLSASVPANPGVDPGPVHLRDQCLDALVSFRSCGGFPCGRFWGSVSGFTGAGHC